MTKPNIQVCVLAFLLLIGAMPRCGWLNAQETIILSQSPIVLEHARQTVRAYGIAPTAQGTSDFLSELVSEDTAEIRELIANLDSDQYTAREAAEAELVKKGPKASALLKSTVKTAGPEARSRAARCLKRISTEWNSIQQAAVIVFAGDSSKEISGSAKIKLLIRLGNKLPDPQLQTAIASAIAQNANPDSKEDIIAGLQSDKPVIRRACVLGLPNCVSVQELSRFQSLLTDPNDEIAFSALVAFGKHFPKTAVTHLSNNLLNSSQKKTRQRANWMLKLISKNDFGYLEHESDSKRRDAIAKWQAWAQSLTPDQKLDFSKLATTNQNRPQGFVVSVNGSGATIIDLKGNVVREITRSLYDAKAYPGQQMLICERDSGTVRLLDQKSGKSLRAVEGLNSPSDAELLASGNILALQGSGIATEHDMRGRIVRSFDGLSNPFDVDRLDNGNTIVADSGNNRLVEFGPTGKIVWEKNDLAFPNNVFRMPDNRTLYTTYSTGNVVMLDADGEEQWRTSIENGTLYSVYCGGSEIYVADGSNQKIVVLDMNGKPRREINIGISFCDIGFITE